LLYRELSMSFSFFGY